VRQFNSPLIFSLLFALAFDLGLWIYERVHGWPIEATAIVADPVVQRRSWLVSGAALQPPRGA
jgi:hypothetical protein